MKSLLLICFVAFQSRKLQTCDLIDSSAGTISHSSDGRSTFTGHCLDDKLCTFAAHKGHSSAQDECGMLSCSHSTLTLHPHWTALWSKSAKFLGDDSPFLGPMSGSETGPGRQHTQSNKPCNINLRCQIHCKGTHESLCMHTLTKEKARRQLSRHPVSNTDRQWVNKRLDAVGCPLESQGREGLRTWRWWWTPFAPGFTV